MLQSVSPPPQVNTVLFNFPFHKESWKIKCIAVLQTNEATQGIFFIIFFIKEKCKYLKAQYKYQSVKN